MVSKQSCLSEEELWTLVETQRDCSPTELDTHVQFCEDCRHRFKRLQSSLDDVHRYWEVYTTTPANSECATNESISNTCQLRSGLEDCEFHKTSLPNGTLVSKYRICQCLSSGGQACVYLAEDIQLNRLVAVKLAHFSIDENIAAAEMILSEGELLAKVNHPRLAQVYDSGLHAGHPFLVTEYVEGCTLKDYIQSQTLSVRRIRLIILDVVNAVEAIHAHQILHLDLKPENVMVASNGRCKLIDLGTAWSMVETAENTGTLVGGTIAYMAPEQYSGDADRYSQRTDVFGLGAILFALLLGKPPITQTPTTNNSVIRLWEKAREELQDSNVNKELKKIALKSINISPESRHHNTTAFRNSIEATTDRRMAFSVISMGVAIFLTGIFSVCIEHQRNVFLRNDHRFRPNVVANKTEASTDYGRRFVKIVARNSLPGQVEFCLWSEQTGVRFFPSIQSTDEQGQFCHKLKVSHEGINLTEINGPIAFLAFRPNGQKTRNISEIRRKLARRLIRLYSKSVQYEGSKIDNTAQPYIQSRSAVQDLHLQLTAGLQSFCGVLIKDETGQDNCVQYEIELFMDDQRSTVERMEPG